MKKLLRACLAIIILLIVVIIFIAAGLIYFIDPNKMKPIIVNEIAKKTGLQTAIEGTLTWSFYPEFGIQAKRLALTKPNETAPLVDLRGVTFVTEAKQLLHGYRHLQGEIRMSDVYLMKVHASNAHIRLHLQPSGLLLDPITAEIYSGSLSGALQGENLRTLPHWSWDLQLRQIQVKPLFTDLGSQSKITVAGMANLSSKGETSGQDKEALIRNLTGGGSFSMTSGKVEGLDLNYLVDSADALINKRALTLPQHIAETNFQSLTANYTLSNGAIDVLDLLLDSSSFITKGRGRIDLLTETLDWQLQVVPVEPGKIKWMVPVLIDGSLNAPSVRLDMQLINAIITKEQIEQAKTKVQQTLKTLPEKANKYIEKILGH